MRTYLFIRRTVLVASLAMIPWVPALLAHAAELSPRAGIPEIMAVQPSMQRDAPVVMTAPPQATSAHGINENAADELSNFAQIVTPIQGYGISAPRSGVWQYGSEVPSSGSSQ